MKDKNYLDEILNKNEISIIIDLKDNDVDKDIYFLDNYFYDNNQKKNEFYNGLKEINETNVELYIDDKYKYKKYHKFSKGKHKMILKLKIKDCSKMFSECKHLTNIDLSSFYTFYVTDKHEMFLFF